MDVLVRALRRFEHNGTRRFNDQFRCSRQIGVQLRDKGLVEILEDRSTPENPTVDAGGKSSASPADPASPEQTSSSSVDGETPEPVQTPSVDGETQEPEVQRPRPKRKAKTAE